MAEPRTVTSEPVEAWITGIGLATSLDEGLDANWNALQQRKVNADEQTFAPYVVHPLAPIAFEGQIPKKEQRQMEGWQRIGTYAAGLALELAGLKGNTDVLSKMDMIVAAGGGERDLAVDASVLTDGLDKLNDRLMNDLRPTLFLAQLSNLLAGNIAIVHGVTGSSRTFMGEEAAGVDAARIALARIASGQSDIALIGASHNGERKDLLMLYEFGDFNIKNKVSSVWAREQDGGFALGSVGAFLVIELKAHAEARGAKPLARLTRIVADHSLRKQPGDVTTTLDKLWTDLKVPSAETAVITGVTGAQPSTAEEQAFLKSRGDLPVRATGTSFGHALEAQFPLGLGLAALALSRGELYAPNDSTGFEVETTKTPDQIVVIGTGHWRGEGMALVEAIR